MRLTAEETEIVTLLRQVEMPAWEIVKRFLKDSHDRRVRDWSYILSVSVQDLYSQAPVAGRCKRPKTRRGSPNRGAKPEGATS